MSNTLFELDDIFSEDACYQGTEPVILRESAIVPRDDCEPFSIIDPDIMEGPWIAGGACIQWYQGLPVKGSDIDVFCRDDKQAQAVIDRVKSYNRYSIMAITDNAVTIRYYSGKDSNISWLIQIIRCRYFDSLPAILDSFDLSVCQIGTDGDSWKLGEHTALDIKNKQLRFVRTNRPEAVKRLVKYWTYGYTPVEGTLEAIQTNDELTWSFTHEDYTNAF